MFQVRSMILRGLVFLILLAPATALAQDEDWGDGPDDDITIDEADNSYVIRASHAHTSA